MGCSACISGAASIASTRHAGTIAHTTTASFSHVAIQIILELVQSSYTPVALPSAHLWRRRHGRRTLESVVAESNSTVPEPAFTPRRQLIYAINANHLPGSWGFVTTNGRGFEVAGRPLYPAGTNSFNAAQVNAMTKDGVVSMFQVGVRAEHIGSVVVYLSR